MVECPRTASLPPSLHPEQQQLLPVRYHYQSHGSERSPEEDWQLLLASLVSWEHAILVDWVPEADCEPDVMLILNTSTIMKRIETGTSSERT